MIKYTIKDVKALAVEVAHFFQDKNVKNWLKIVDNVKKEFSFNPKEMILELLGPYVFSFPRAACKEIGLTDLIFETSVKEMPFYIESENDWEKIVARWRITIQK